MPTASLFARAAGCLGLCGVLLAGGCDPGASAARQSSTSSRAAGPIARVLVLVAASAHDAVVDAARDFEARTGVAVAVCPGASNALALQIEQGAPADIFLSASDEWIQHLDKLGLLGAQRPLLGNRLVLIVPRGNPAGVRRPDDLLAGAVQHVTLAGANVPAGRYAEQALRHAGVFADLEAGGRIVRGQDVRFALGYVERGEAQAGLVYATDARLSSAIDVVHKFDAAGHEPIVYTLARLKSAPGGERARELFDALCSAEAWKHFERRGFSRPAAHEAP